MRNKTLIHAMRNWQYENCRPGTKAEQILKSMAEVEQILETVDVKKKKPNKTFSKKLK